MSRSKTKLDHRTEERWSTVLEDGTTYCSGETRAEAIASHHRSVRDIKEAVAEVRGFARGLGPVDSERELNWQRLERDRPIAALRRVVTTTVTVIDTYPDEPYEGD